MIVLFPIYITIVNSLLEPDRIAARPPTLFPSSPDWGSYRNAWNAGHIGAYLRNSFIVTALIVTGQLVTSILAAYAFAFLEFPFKRIIFVLFLTTMMIPFEVVFFTNLDTVSSLGDVPGIGKYIGFNTYGALALPFLATGFGAFLAPAGVPVVAARPPRRRRARRLRPHALPRPGRGAAVAARRSPRSRCSPSSRRGTSTCGRSS